MFSLPKIPSTPSELFSAYASFTGTLMLVRSMADQLIPEQLRSYLYSTVHQFFTPPSSHLTLIIDEYCGYTCNQMYNAAETYLCTKINPSAQFLKISKAPRQKSLTIAMEKGEEMPDSFDNIKLMWKFICSDPPTPHSGEKRSFSLTFKKKYKDRVLEYYLPYIMIRSKEIKEEQKVVKLYTRDCGYYDEEGNGSGIWGCINLDHPSTFDTMAIDPEVKKAIIDDLERFVKRREFYKKVGKAWKRGYLLYGPPGTGKSSLIAAMANYLKFDIYDLELTSICSNSDLRRVLVSTSNRSILVIEDIDCSMEAQNRQDGNEGRPLTKLTLSGLLNFIDGLWSSCGDERIIVFTTNHKDRLDPALLRPGRMDMHIHMSYCSPHGFKILASNYLGIHGNHHLCGEIESLIGNTEVTPAEVAEELMKSDDPDIALGGIVNLLKRKKIEGTEIKDKEADRIDLKEAKKLKTKNNKKPVERNSRRKSHRRKT